MFQFSDLWKSCFVFEVAQILNLFLVFKHKWWLNLILFNGRQSEGNYSFGQNIRSLETYHWLLSSWQKFAAAQPTCFRLAR
jgi:hypothetical protein